MIPHKLCRLSNLSLLSLSSRVSLNKSLSLNLSNPNTRQFHSRYRCLLLITRKTNNLITLFQLNPNTNKQILLHLNLSILLKYSNSSSTQVPVLSLNNNSNSPRNSSHLLRSLNLGAEKTD